MTFIWQYPAEVDSVHDGDTVTVHMQVSAIEERHGVDCRIEGINALELRDKFGAEARDALAKLLPPGTPVILVHRRKEKFGRFLVRITLPDGTDVSDKMLTALASDGVTHLAVPYAG
ncbi:MAG: thermonuclease family protein [Blastocatellia bacterium]|nr:thermonuclease family protein [Blastocatellia bacterium]